MDINEFLNTKIDYKELKLVDARRLLLFAQDLAQDAFSLAKNKGYWMTVKGDITPVEDLEPDHLYNILKIFKRKYIAEAQANTRALINANPGGEMAQDAVDNELERWEELDSDEQWQTLMLTHEPIYPKLYARAKELGMTFIINTFPDPEYGNPGVDIMLKYMPIPNIEALIDPIDSNDEEKV